MTVPTLPGWAEWCPLSTPKVAGELGFMRSVMLERQRRDGVRFSDETWEFVAGLEAFARHHRERAASAGVVSDVVATTGDSGSSVMVGDVIEPTVSVTEAAERFGCTRQAVLARIKRRTLPSTQDAAGQHRIPLTAVEETL